MRPKSVNAIWSACPDESGPLWMPLANMIACVRLCLPIPLVCPLECSESSELWIRSESPKSILTTTTNPAPSPSPFRNTSTHRKLPVQNVIARYPERRYLASTPKNAYHDRNFLTKMEIYNASSSARRLFLFGWFVF